MSPPLDVVHGGSAVIVVAPHGGRRDHARRPWGSARLRMNDLHTGAVARALAGRLDASALVNERTDRNDVDLNRVSAAHDRAPEFLATLAALVERAVSRHDRAVVVVVHGWNVTQPAVDVGLGADPGIATAGGSPSAVSAGFARTALPRLAASLEAAGIAVTPGLRYPARARENLLQLFTGRHVADPRPAVRRLATLGDRVDALQLELSLPLRLPGPWRDRFVGAATVALGTPATAVSHAWPTVVPSPATATAVEFVAPHLSGFAAIDAQGGRLVLFHADGRLTLFTGERVGRHAADAVAGLRLRRLDAGVVDVAYDGPLLAFPDTTPFLDLERGLATAAVVDGRVAFTLRAFHEGDGTTCPFGTAVGTALLDGAALPIDGHGVHTAARPDPEGGVHAALRLRSGVALLARGRDGLLCRDGAHRPVRGCTVADAGDAVRVRALLDDGAPLDLRLDVRHRLPVVPGDPGRRRVAFASCSHGGAPAGWVTLVHAP